MENYIVGHKNPDTDSVVSAICLAYLENKIDRPHKAAIAGLTNKETEYVLARFGFKTPVSIPAEEKGVILVDHNEPSQISENVSLEEIKCIVDHHKLGGLALAEPISVRTKPLGSTATLVAEIFEEKQVEIPKEIASLLIAGILSDTLKFTSPTSTEDDKKTVEKLNKIASLNIDDLSKEMFEAKSDLTGISEEEIITADYKEFDIKGKKIGVGVFETVNPGPALERREKIVENLKQRKASTGLNGLIFAVIDILEQKAYFVVSDEADSSIIKKAFNLTNESLMADNIVSRKKQIIPALEKSL